MQKQRDDRDKKFVTTELVYSANDHKMVRTGFVRERIEIELNMLTSLWDLVNQAWKGKAAERGREAPEWGEGCA